VREVVADLEAHNLIPIVQCVGLLGVVPSPVVCRAILERAMQVALSPKPHTLNITGAKLLRNGLEHVTFTGRQLEAAS